MPARRLTRTADEVALSLVPTGEVVDAVATFWSTIARGGSGWAATTVALSVAGGAYRRAGLEGLAAWTAAESTAAVLKAATSRRRPPRPRGRTRTHSSSLPSSHTAAGVAYAVAAGTRAPVLALPLGAAALAVGWSRLATRRHYPTDVAAGGLLGVALGGATAALSRRAFP